MAQSDATSSSPVLLLTRPAAASDRFAHMYRERFGQERPVVISPLTQIVPTGAAVPGAGTLIFTSENAVLCAGAGRGRAAWCVGARTGAVATANGYQVVQGPGDGAGLVERILQSGDMGPFVHLRGTEVALPVAMTLRQAGRLADEVIVYAQCDRPLSTPAQTLFNRPGWVIAPVFSAQSAQRLARALPVHHHPRLSIVVISAACRDYFLAEHIEMASHPNADGVLDAIERILSDDQAG